MTGTRGRALVFFFLIWAAYALQAYQFSFICDDAFISFRYARNWAEGNGLRYNLGSHTPVEGYSNFLWVAFCAVVELCNADVTFWSQLVSFACGSILLYLVFSFLRSQCQTNMPVACLATLLLGCSPPFTMWSTGGLETMPFALLLFVTFERLLLRREGVAVVGGAVAGLALALIRVEGIYWFTVIVALAIVSRRLASQKSTRSLLYTTAICLTGYIAYFLCRYAYYELPFPNTAYAKVDIREATLKRGACYVTVQFLTLLTPFLILPGTVVALRKKLRPIGLPVALMAIAIPMYAVIVSGDFMAMGRLLVPGLAFNALLFGWLLQACWGRSMARQVSVAALAGLVITVAMLPAWDTHLVPKSVREVFHFRFANRPYQSEWKQWRSQKRNALRWAKMGRALRNHSSPGDSLVAIAIGAVGYYSNLFIYDQAGLVNRKVAIRVHEGPLRTSPGHDKMVDADFFAPERPTFLMAVFLEGVTESQMIQGMRRYAKELRQMGLKESYVPEYVRVDQTDSKHPPRYLLLWRLIGENEYPNVAWRKFRLRLESLGERRSAGE